MVGFDPLRTPLEQGGYALVPERDRSPTDSSGGTTSPSASKYGRLQSARWRQVSPREAELPHSLPFVPGLGIVAEAEVQDLANAWAEKTHKVKDSVVAMSWCVGPVLVMLRNLNVLQVLVQGGVVAVGTSLVECRDDGSVSYPPYIWLIAASYMVLILRMEYRCLKYATIPFIQATSRFRLLWFDVGFTIWALDGFIQSIMFHVAAFTQSLFVASSMACNKNPLLAKWWQISLSDSDFVQILGIEWLQLWHVVLLIWGVTQLRCIHAIVYSLPRMGSPGLKTELASIGSEGGIGTGGFHFQNYLNSGRVTTGEVFGLLAEGVGMHTIMAMRPEYPRVRARHRIDQVHKSWQAQQDLDKLTHKVEEVLQFGHDSISRASIRLVYNGLFKVAFGAEVQVSRLALVMASQSGHKAGSHFSYFSIVSTLILAPLTVKYVAEVIHFTNKLWKAINELVEKGIIDQHFSRHHDGTTVSIPYQHHYIKFQTANSIILCAMFVTTLLHTVTKLIMAHLCPHSLWNTPWPLTTDLYQGCSHAG